MKKEEFASLPLKTALELIYDMAVAKLEPLPRPSVPRPPKYDDRLARKNGFVWVSEMLLADLIWWREKKREGAASGGPYAEKDAKLVEKLSKWIEWRSLFPTEVWSGTRGDDRATAAPPSRDAKLQRWPARSQSSGDQQDSDPQPEPEGEQYNF